LLVFPNDGVKAHAIKFLQMICLKHSLRGEPMPVCVFRTVHIAAQLYQCGH
jgi:hypothetical protein